MNYKTEQEEFWAGKFGDDYISRNNNSQLLSSNIFLFSSILRSTSSISSVIEFGANIGLNLRAIKTILPSVNCTAVEINSAAVNELRLLENLNVYHGSIFDFCADDKKDFVLIKGVLIHLNPDKLNDAYNVLYSSSSRYICIAEYYNPTPVEIEYRGASGRLFKRDFAGELMDKFNDLELIDYGFIYHRDKNFPQDDITWFLLEKK